MEIPGFEEFHINTAPSVTIFGVKKVNDNSKLPPILLVHGYPQSHLIWHKIAPQLSEKFTVVAIDLRGYGKSSKPINDEDINHSLYSKRSMASDCIEVMASLGYKKFYYVGHDRGARVGHRLCVDYPENVIKAIFLDIAPTLAMYKSTDKTFASLYYHWFFLLQPSPFPETFITSNAKLFVESFLGGFGQVKSLEHIEPSHLAEYINYFSTFEGAHSTTEDYRASATIDLEHDQQDIDKGRKLVTPLRVLWGKEGVIEHCFNGISLWKEVAANVSGHTVNSGHFIPEEAPQEVLKEISDFF